MIHDLFAPARLRMSGAGHFGWSRAPCFVTMSAVQAEGGEVFATDIVRQLASSAGLQFLDLGLFHVSASEDPVRLYEVKWE